MNYNSKVTEKVFGAIKLLLENGASIAEAAKFMKLSDYTVSLIKKSEDFAEYKSIRAELALKKKKSYMAVKEAEKKPEEKKENAPDAKSQTVIYKPTWEMMQEMQKTNEYLKQISAKLAFIVDELCGTKVV